MDSLTHVALGAAIGEAVLGKKIGRAAMIWGALADTIPDFDVFTAAFVTDAQQLLIHRGITHSFLFVLFMSPIMGWLFSKWFRKADVNWKQWSWLFFLGMFTHIIIDAFTSYGTGWFEPFNSYRVSFNTIFVADPFYTLPLLFCLIIALVANNGSSKRIKWNTTGLIISTAYLVFTVINKWHVHHEIEDALNKKSIQTTEVVTTPTPLNNFLWMTYAPDATGYWIGYYSVFDKTNDIEFYHLNKNDSLLKPFKNDETVNILKQFSKGYYTVARQDSSLLFNDIRFGQRTFHHPDSSFVFSFKLDKAADNTMALDRMKFETSFTDALIVLVNRIKGK